MYNSLSIGRVSVSVRPCFPSNLVKEGKALLFLGKYCGWPYGLLIIDLKNL
jgi:hypothetical protein